MSGPKQLAEKGFELLQGALEEAETRAKALEAELNRRTQPESQLAGELEALQQRVKDAEVECERWRHEAGRLDDVVQAERAKCAQLKRKLEIAESGPDTLTRREINFWRSKAETFDEQTREYRDRIAALRRQAKEAERRLEGLSAEQAAREERLRETEAAAERMRDTLAERDARIAKLTAQVEQLSARSTRLEEERAEAVARADRSEAELRSLSETQASLKAELEHAQREVARLLAHRSELEKARDEARGLIAALEKAKDEARQHISALEIELRDEKECTENLSELANERREQLTKLEERLEEAEERYEDARWRLGKAAHFERLVKRRKKLIRSLIAALRSKHKSNTALKAGIDALRTHKAAAEANQQKLLSRIDSLKTSLGRAEEAIARQHGATLAREQLADAEARALQLEQRLGAQAEVLQSLEEELKAAKAFRHRDDERELDRGGEITELRRALASKDELIESLRTEADDAARELAKLRRREANLPAGPTRGEDKNENQIAALQREVTSPRDRLNEDRDEAATRSGEDIARHG